MEVSTVAANKAESSALMLAERGKAAELQKFIRRVESIANFGRVVLAAYSPNAVVTRDGDVFRVTVVIRFKSLWPHSPLLMSEMPWERK